MEEGVTTYWLQYFCLMKKFWKNGDRCTYNIVNIMNATELCILK